MTQIQQSMKDNYVVCLKYGTKYGADYVNKLHNMVSRNLTLDHEFVCFTEDHTGIDSRVRIEPLPWQSNIQGWWYKPFVFDPEFILKGNILFLDLDLVIFKNIDNLFAYYPGEFVILQDFNRHIIKNYDKFNSSVFRIQTGDHQQVYKKFIENPRAVTQRFRGDQDWIRHCIKSKFRYWPTEWIQSYKWEIRDKKDLIKDPSGKLTFKNDFVPDFNKNTSIAVFHGDPNPSDCNDSWVLDNWR